MNEVFVARAKQLRDARELIHDERSVASATALLAVHSGIALNDALLTIWRGEPFKAEDHRAAIRETEAQCKSRKVNEGGVKHLKTLIESKSRISYGEEPVTAQQATTLALAARRFEAWTFSICKELAKWEQQQSIHHA